LVAGVLAGVTDIVYLKLIAGQDDPALTSGRVLLFATAIGSVAVAAAAGALAARSAAAKALAVYAAVGLWVLGTLGLFSIGFPLLVAMPFAVASAVGRFRR
jgi:hypothetical protein